MPSGLPTKASSAWSVNRPCSTTPRVDLRAVARAGRSPSGRAQSRRWWPSSVTNAEAVGGAAEGGRGDQVEEAAAGGGPGEPDDLDRQGLGGAEVGDELGGLGDDHHVTGGGDHQLLAEEGAAAALEEAEGGVDLVGAVDGQVEGAVLVEAGQLDAGRPGPGLGPGRGGDRPQRARAPARWRRAGRSGRTRPGPTRGRWSCRADPCPGGGHRRGPGRVVQEPVTWSRPPLVCPGPGDQGTPRQPVVPASALWAPEPSCSFQRKMAGHSCSSPRTERLAVPRNRCRAASGGGPRKQGGEDAELVAVGEQQDPAARFGQLVQQPPGPLGGVLDRLAAGAAVAEQVPPGPGGADLGGGPALVLAVVEFEQGAVVVPVAEAGQPGGGPTPASAGWTGPGRPPGRAGAGPRALASASPAALGRSVRPVCRRARDHSVSPCLTRYSSTPIASRPGTVASGQPPSEEVRAMMDHPLTIRTIYQRAPHPVPAQADGDQAGAAGGVPRRIGPRAADHLRRLGGARGQAGGRPARAGVGLGEGAPPSAGTTTGTWRCTSRPPLMGVLHTVNIRLSAQDITYIVNHAGDEVLIVDASLWHILSSRSARRPHHRQARDRHEGHPGRGAAGRARLDYEQLVMGTAPVTEWPAHRGDGRGGHLLHLRHHRTPEGRALHPPRDLPALAVASSTVDVLGICERDVILHIVPMFHANAWCVPFAGG